VDTVTFEGPDSVVRGSTLSFTFTAAEGFGVTSMTVGGTKVEIADAKSGKVSVPGYIGGEIEVVVEEFKEEPTTSTPDTPDTPDTNDDTKAEKGGNTTTIIIAVAAVAAVIVIAGAAILLKKKKQ